MAERPWGFWTESKLDVLSAYLHGFTTACRRDELLADGCSQAAFASATWPPTSRLLAANDAGLPPAYAQLRDWLQQELALLALGIGDARRALLEYLVQQQGLSEAPSGCSRQPPQRAR